MKKAKRLLLLILGVLFILLGIAGLALPFVQGFLFLAVGITMLSAYSPRIRHFFYGHTARYPKLHARIGAVEKWLVRIFDLQE